MLNFFLTKKVVVRFILFYTFFTNYLSQKGFCAPSGMANYLRTSQYHSRITRLRRRLMMITGDWPTSSVKMITEGITGNTTNVMTGWVVDGVCGHWHDGVLMGG